MSRNKGQGQGQIVVAEGGNLEEKSKGLVRRKKSEISQQPTSNAVIIEELEQNFDEDLRMAIFSRLLSYKEEIKKQATQEMQVSQALELARLASVEQAREQGVQLARAEIADRKQLQKQKSRIQFIEEELPKLLDSCDYLPYETMKFTINSFAKRAGVTLEWKELENGEFECVPI